MMSPVAKDSDSDSVAHEHFNGTSRSDVVESSRIVCPAGRHVTLFNDELFSQLRKLAGVPANFVNEGWNLDDLESGGAKGGCRMAFVGSEYVVKELSSDDHESLFTISPSFFEHVRNGDTLLGMIFLHFEDVSTGRRFFVMRNVTGSGPFLAMYDLKGCSDDKTLELFGRKIKAADMLLSSVGRLCGPFCPQNLYDSWAEAKAAKCAATRVDLVVTEKQREEVIRRLRQDTDWLTRHQLMDYSLIVAVKTGPPGFAPEARFGQSPLVRDCTDGTEVAVCVGIIDFLQKWNFKKKVAQTIKCCEVNKATIPPAAYSARFCEYFEDRFVCPKMCEVAKTLEEDEECAMLRSVSGRSIEPSVIGASVFA